MKEIGGYFQFEKLKGKEYYSKLVAINTGRNALLYLLRLKGIKKLHIPFFICDSVLYACKKEGVDCIQYRIGKDFWPIFEKQLNKKEYIYVVNYYGQLSNKQILKLKKKYKYIIIDNTQAFFQRPVKNVDTIYSCRKFFGVPDGAYVYTNNVLNKNLIQDSSKDRFKHLLGRYEGCASDYYADFKQNDELFRELPLKSMSDITHNIMSAIDYKRIKKVRKQNYALLDRLLSKNNQLDLSAPLGPFCYPFFDMDAPYLRKELAKVNIYIPTLWPNVLETMASHTLEYNYASKIMPIPCDQRYNEFDMIYIYNKIQEIKGEKNEYSR